MIANLVEDTWLVQYPWPVENMHDRGRKFLGHKFKDGLIEKKYGIKTKTAYSRNPQ